MRGPAPTVERSTSHLRRGGGPTRYHQVRRPGDTVVSDARPALETRRERVCVEVEGSPGRHDEGSAIPARARTAAADRTPRRVLTILRYLAGHRPLSTLAIVRECHIPRSPPACIASCASCRRSASSSSIRTAERWGLGPSSYELASSYVLPDSLARQSQSVVARLTAETGASMAAVARGARRHHVMMLSASRQPVTGLSRLAWRRPSATPPISRRPAGRCSPNDREASSRPSTGKGRWPDRRGAARGRSRSSSRPCRRSGSAGSRESAGDLADGIWACARRCAAQPIVSWGRWAQGSVAVPAARLRCARRPRR